ncbi:TauD/TfdA dioxygenase family protein [Kineosporia babensis]|uniref:TauD/TfdA family dioxygenase n=1 Tax=Kineosporia babensis TaxID=499548 RepID=A0A9X1SYK3_9ACTN|nr:TauD/TfdA family dioxygenase [Kineosporia babensis]MCD5317019.1 TauD/TfdA family dioxygenase [Kineosporia babensis]
MKITRVGTYLGAMVEDFTLDPGDPDLGKVLRQLLTAHKVVKFKRQFLSPADHVAVAATIATPEIHPFGSEKDPVVQGITPFQPYREQPEVSGIYHTAEHTGNLNAWHSDLNWRQYPTYASVLIARKIPPVGGDTVFADMSAAFLTLPAEIREELQGLKVEHDWMNIYRKSFASNPELLATLREKYPAQYHPLVLTHPVSKAPVLFSNRVSGRRFVGTTDERSLELMDLVHRRASLPEVQCRFSWEAGDVTMWDNLAVQHYAVSDYAPHERRMERVTVSSERLWD